MDIYKILESAEAKSNFLKGLIRISKSDGSIDENEKIFFEQAAVALGLSEEEKKSISAMWDSNEKIEVFFENAVEKNFFFIQAIQLCWVDGGYTVKEKEEIDAMAVEIGVRRGVVEVIENWAYEGIQWNNKGNKLLELE